MMTTNCGDDIVDIVVVDTYCDFDHAA